MLDFIAAFVEPLGTVSPCFRADPRPNGGTLFRIHRDVRFSRDKPPYKTNVGAHFRHVSGKDAHAPGFYLHLEPETCFAACGIWHPDNETLARIRGAIVHRPEEWRHITTAKKFRRTFELSGRTLKWPLRGYDPAHPLIEDLKRRDFIASTGLSENDVCRSSLLERFTKLARTGSKFVEFLCRAVGVSF